MTVTPPFRTPRFSEADADRAYEEWGANCGPGALAGMTGLSLDQVRPHMGDFESKGYTNPTLMYAALDSIGASWVKLGREWPEYGLVRVQWEGPWTEPQVPMRARFRYTHWIGTVLIHGDRGIFDINCMNNGVGWVSLEDWSREIAPHLTAQHRRATGGWHITNGIAIRELPSLTNPARRS